LPKDPDEEFKRLYDMLGNEHRHRGYPITDWVEGARMIFPWEDY
jgi:hypothetical protein